MAHLVKNLPAMWETGVLSLGWEDPLEESMATHSSILSWRIPMDRGAWWATVHGVTKRWTWLTKHRHHNLYYITSCQSFWVITHLIRLSKVSLWIIPLFNYCRPLSTCRSLALGPQSITKSVAVQVPYIKWHSICISPTHILPMFKIIPRFQTIPSTM